MNKSKSFRDVVGTTFIVLLMLLFFLPASLAGAANPTPLCAADSGCAKQKAVLRQLEKTRPSKKITRRQIFNRIKAACDKMRSLDCPDIKNYKPLICFTDF